MSINELCDLVRETSFAIHKYHRNGHLIIELKAARCIAEEHIAQILGYLKSARIHDGLLINFGAPKLYIKKYVQD